MHAAAPVWAAPVIHFSQTNHIANGDHSQVHRQTEAGLRAALHDGADD